MTPATFRRLALGLPDAVEGEHRGHPDFRVGAVRAVRGRIFATLFVGPDGHDQGMVKVTPREQAALVRDHPDVFEPCAGAWGRQGCTAVRLAAARVAMVKGAVESAWREAAAKGGGTGARKRRSPK